MKNILFILLAIVTFSCQSNKSSKVEASTDQVKVELTEVTFAVSGMTCDHCVASINKKVGELAGVDFVETTLADSTTIVKFDKSKVKVTEIAEAIDSRGFKATALD